jgi:hypothetical protein
MDCELVLRALGALNEDGSAKKEGSPIGGMVWRLERPSLHDITLLGTAIAVAELTSVPQEQNRIDPATIANFFAGDLVQSRIAAVMGHSGTTTGKIYAVLGEGKKELVRIDLTKYGESSYQLRLYLPKEGGGVYGIHPDVVRKVFASPDIADHHKDKISYEAFPPSKSP